MKIEKINPYTDGIRDGFFECLIQLKTILEKKNDPFTREDLRLYINGALEDLSTFISYGANCEAYYQEWVRDKKGKRKATKLKLYAPGTNMIRTADGYRSRAEVMDLILTCVAENGKTIQSNR